jgi:DNA-binding NarL/FixJ family response regulator
MDLAYKKRKQWVMCVVSTTILMVNVSDKSQVLKELPVRLLMMDTGAEAIQCLREERIDTVISQWELIDMPRGKLLENVRGAIPAMPTIAFIAADNMEQEIAARSLGVTVVLSEDVDDDYFRKTVCNLLGFSEVAAMQLAEIET